MNQLSLALLLLSHLAATLFMTGAIWFVQIVHYPLFKAAGSQAFPAYERRHKSLTTWVVAPPMLVEATTAGLLFWFRPTCISTWQLSVGVVLLTVIWLSTALFQVPAHEVLSDGFDSQIHRRLVLTNWIRTIAWSMRGLLVLWMAAAWKLS